MNTYLKPVIRREVFYTDGSDIHGLPKGFFRTFDTHDYKLISNTWTRKKSVRSLQLGMASHLR